MYKYASNHCGAGLHEDESVAALLYPCRSVRDEMRRLGQKPKDHHVDNLRSIRITQRIAQQRRAETDLRRSMDAEARPRTADKYQGVRSKVRAELARPSTAPSSHKFLRKGEAKLRQKDTRPERAPKACARRPPIPSAYVAPTRHEQKNFISANVNKIHELDYEQQDKKLVAEQELAHVPPTKFGVDADAYGQVPSYLEARKHTLADAAAARVAVVEEKKHPGLVLLKSAERLDLLDDMQRMHATKTAELQRLPIAMSTLRLRNLKSNLERELDSLERDIRRFSNATVLVQKG